MQTKINDVKIEVGGVYKTCVDGDIIVLSKSGEFSNIMFLETSNEYCTQTNKIKYGNIKDKNKDRTPHFIKDCVDVHGEKYSYEKTVFTIQSNNIIVTCPIHGDFEIRASCHKQGQGCAACARDMHSSKITKTTADFIAASKVKFGDKFVYTKTEYQGTDIPVILTCPAHGDIEITPASHNRCMTGCLLCSSDTMSARRSMEFSDFVMLSKERYGDVYSYDPSTYINMSSKAYVTCKRHGAWGVIANSHVHRTSGCPQCLEERRGHKRNRKWILYLLESDGLFKVGVSSRESAIGRVREINSSAYPLVFKHVMSFQMLRNDCLDLEGKLLAKFRALGCKNPEMKFGGYTETFSGLPLNYVIKIFEDTVRKEQ